MGSAADSGVRGRLWRSRWAAIGAAIAVSVGGGGLFVANAASSTPASVVTIDPVRILDTRDPVNIGLAGPFVSPVSQKLTVAGAAIPAGSSGVLLNVTVVDPSADGFLSIRPGDATGSPSTSSLNFDAGDVIPNSVQVGLPTTGANVGQIDITYDALGVAGPTTDVLIDVVGYLAPVGTDGDGWGRPYVQAHIVPTMAGCPAGQIRLEITVTGAVDVFPAGPTACQPLFTEGDNDNSFIVALKPGAPLAKLYSVRKPGSMADEGPVDPDGVVVGATSGTFGCSTGKEAGIVACFLGTQGPTNPLSNGELQALFDAGLAADVFINIYNS